MVGRSSRVLALLATVMLAPAAAMPLAVRLTRRMGPLLGAVVVVRLSLMASVMVVMLSILVLVMRMANAAGNDDDPGGEVWRWLCCRLCC